jgi:uncharacterized protein (UPF0248 family)
MEWGEGIPLDNLTFIIVDRGSPGDVRELGYPEVLGRDRSYLHLQGGGRVPYHRVLEVRAGERVLWSRQVDGDEGAQ